ncbi:TRAP transporter substrate-binding protein [Pseudodesulfovibrio sp.]|uniref:TRAP transporter substrate-binding protein n=1 Tax=Pseudodesulfovibrio sp. TaxID=2035812 RepID=UPI0026070F73|nr:TRAP transporter substrate-binding protein [Pseudodesulfovibrio sp.]MDD3312129.1 TRAP transporter substrate-binding protein [Pseudodesulfovibrio sp.]
MKFHFNSISRLLLGLAAVALVAGVCANAEAATYVAKIGHLESAQQSRNTLLVKVAQLVKERTNGDVEFQIYPQGQLGGQRQMNEGVQLGTLEGTVAPAAFLGGFNPMVSILDVPYLYPDDDARSQQLRESKFGQMLLDSFADKGVAAITIWPNGRKCFSSNKPIDTIEEFKGQKFRVMDSKILIEQFKAIGASAIALPFSELYTALQTGVVDGEENPLDTIQRMKYFEVQKNFVISYHGLMEDFVLFNQMWWEGLPENYRTIIRDAFLEVIPELVAHKAQAVAAALDDIKSHGVNVRVLTSEEKAQFRAKMFKPSMDVFLSKTGDKGKKLFDVYTEEYNRIMK